MYCYECGAKASEDKVQWKWIKINPIGSRIDWHACSIQHARKILDEMTLGETGSLRLGINLHPQGVI